HRRGRPHGARDQRGERRRRAGAGGKGLSVAARRDRPRAGDCIGQADLGKIGPAPSFSAAPIPSVLVHEDRHAGLTMTTILHTPATSERLAGFVAKTPLERYVAPATPSLIGLSRAELAESLGAAGVPAAQRRMRVQQIWNWLYVRGATSFDQMTSVSKELRAVLADRFTLARPEVVAEQVSVDGTRKWLLRLPGETAGERPHEVECV